jgi:MFS family permease
MTSDPIASAPPLPERGALTIIALATFLALVVFTVPLTTINAITAEFGLSVSGQAWVMSGMPLGAACGLLAAGAFGDTFGRRRIFTLGLWLTSLSSIAAALAPTGLFLIVMRVVQGLGSAGIMACGLGLLGQIYEGDQRRRATAIWAAALGGGVAAGPILAAGFLVFGGWPAIHWLIALASLALGAASPRRLPESEPSGAPVDIFGCVSLMVGLACLLSALTEARFGLTWLVAALAVSGLGLVGTFVHHEIRVMNPILRIDLFGHGDFTGATLAAFASGAGVLALMSMVPVLLARGTDITPLAAAFVLLAWSGVTVLSALGGRAFLGGLTPRRLTIGALAGCAAGQLLMLLAQEGSGWAIVLPGLFVAGLSNGLLNASLGHAAVQSVPPDRSAMGSAANNTARYLGSALGVALVSVLLAGADGGSLYLRWHQAALVTAAFSILGALVMLKISDTPSVQGG